MSEVVEAPKEEVREVDEGSESEEEESEEGSESEGVDEDDESEDEAPTPVRCARCDEDHFPADYTECHRLVQWMEGYNRRRATTNRDKKPSSVVDAVDVVDAAIKIGEMTCDFYARWKIKDVGGVLKGARKYHQEIACEHMEEQMARKKVNAKTPLDDVCALWRRCMALSIHFDKKGIAEAREEHEKAKEEEKKAKEARVAAKAEAKAGAKAGAKVAHPSRFAPY